MSGGFSVPSEAVSDELLGYDQEQFRRIFDGFPDGILLVSSDGHVKRANSAYARIHGYDSPEEMLGMSVSDLTAPESRRLASRVLQRRLLGEEVPATEYVILRKDGTNSFAETTASALLLDGRPAGYLCIMRDTTERHDAEAALRKSEERYRSLFNGAIEGMYQTTPKGVPISINEAAARMFGYDSPEQALADITDIGRQVWAKPSDRAALGYLMRKQAGLVRGYEAELRRGDGSTFWASLTARIVPATEETEEYWEGFLVDITARKQAEAELLAAEQRFALMFEAAPMAINVTRGVDILYANPAYLRLFGYEDVAELRSIPPLELFVPERRNEILQNIADREIGRPVPNSYECECQRRDGTRVPVWMDFQRVELPDGMASVGFITDISQQKQDIERLAEARERSDKLRAGLVETIGRVIEMRDPYTMGHQAGVAEIAVAIAMELGFDETAIEGIRVAAVLHDVGKIAVPTDILVKPGRLQDYEYDIVKLHVERGYEILAPIDFEWPIAQIVLQHHERMDGSGYPAGLKGGQILLEARILAVADTLDAMTTHRPYRAAESLEVAVREIMSHRHLYDTEVAEGLERAIDAGRIGG